MKPSHRSYLRRLLLASMLLAGWGIYSRDGVWRVRSPKGQLFISRFRNKESAVAFVEDLMSTQGLIEKRYFNGYP